MEARAVQKHIRQSPRKIRRVIDEIRGKTVNEALNLLHFLPHRAARPTEKTIQSAVYNLIDQNPDARIDEESLVIREIYADEGPTLQRYQPAARGRTHPIQKKSTHLTVVVGEKEEETAGEEAEEVEAGA